MPLKMRICGMAKCSLVCRLQLCESALQCLIFYISFSFFAEDFIGEN